jgi:hypothetical protein
VNVCSSAARSRSASSGPALASRARSGRSFTLEFGACAGHRERVELLGDVRLDRVDAQRRRRDPSEAQHVLRHDNLGGTKHRVAEAGVDTERIAVWLAGEAALGAEAHAFVLHPLVGDLGVLRVGPDLEREEVGEVETSGSPAAGRGPLRPMR